MTLKVFSSKQMALLESEAYAQGCDERVFMENAGKGIASHIIDYLKIQGPFEEIILLCGKGNNGGDAFVAGSYLLEKQLPVVAFHPVPLETCSPLCQENGKRFLSLGGRMTDHFSPKKKSLLIDGLFGTGFQGAPREPFASIIQAANQSGCPILSIDIPSGLNGDTGEAEGPYIVAEMTLFLGFPKIGFFFKEGWNAIGHLKGVDFGLPARIVEKEQALMVMPSLKKICSLFPPLPRIRHKYQAGEVIGLAGSPEMPGAALLSSKAAFRAGCGLVRLLHPAGMEAMLSNSPWELIKIPYNLQNPDSISDWLNKGNATFIGPGLGRGPEIARLLEYSLPKLSSPTVLDADALFHYAARPFPLPPQTIFTPHIGEMQRLLHQTEKLENNIHTLETCQRYAEEHQVTLILKGAPTFIFHPNQPISVNPTGNPGMATAGSGDVLSGILASLLAQKLSPQGAAMAGVYLHGLAGDIAASGTYRGLIASDIIKSITKAYTKIFNLTF